MKRKRLLTMIFGAAAIFFTGFPHVWSIYTPYVMEITNWTAGQTSMCFYLALLSFVFGNIIGGRIQDRSDPIRVLSAGGVLQAAGILLSAFSMISDPLPMYLTYGVMHGVGQGMVYTVIISNAQKWFPSRKGFASGIVVTANGLCGFVLAPISRAVLVNAGPQAALLLVGVLMTIAWILSVIFVKIPDGEMTFRPETAQEAGYQYTAGEIVRTKNFYLLSATMMCGLVFYFLVSPISQILQMERGVSQAAAVSAVMIGSLMNAAARLLLPTMADKVGRIVCLQLILLTAAAATGSLVISKSYGVTVGIIIIYGCYGGIMGSFPALSSSMFGSRHSGENYGYVMIGLVISTLVSPLIGSLINSREILFIVGTGFALTALLLITVLGYGLNKNKKWRKRNGTCKNERITG